MVCKNYCLMQLRSGATKLKHDREMHKDFAVLMESDHQLHLTVQNTKEIQLTHMEDCMKGLNAEQKLCIELFFLHEKSYQEVTETTSFTMNNVKSRDEYGSVGRIHPKLDWANLRIPKEHIAYVIEWHDRLWPREPIGFQPTK